MDLEGGKLVVVHTPKIHKKIANLLGNLMSSPESRTILFHVRVPPESEKKISYTVRYRW